MFGNAAPPTASLNAPLNAKNLASQATQAAKIHPGAGAGAKYQKSDAGGDGEGSKKDGEGFIFLTPSFFHLQSLTLSPSSIRI